MLHELLLSLAGHPSPLLSLDSPSSSPDPISSAVTSLASPSELSLLRSVAKLGNLQTAIHTSCAALTSSSTASRTVIAPAVAAAALNGPLAAFQTHVGTVERRILSQDAALVGAYRSVPLAGVVAEFDGWERVLTWIHNVLRFAQTGVDEHQELQTGAQLLDYLRRESRTGYPDVARVCGQLLRAGEAAWVRQLVAWLLYGRLPDIGREDFFIRESSATKGTECAEFNVEQRLAPAFVTPGAAASILFVGRSLHHVQEHLAKEPDSRMQMDINSLVESHLGQLSKLEIPIVSAALARTVGSIRVSLARNALQKLLPMSTIQQVLHVLREFFLLERGEFAMALIGVTDAHLASRSKASEKNDGRLLGGAMIKEAELSAIMGKTWSALAALYPILPDSMDDYEDEALELARDTISLEIRKPHAKKSDEARLLANENVFEDLLVGVPTVLTMSIASPLDMFLGGADLRAYAQIHAYLLALRRAHLHLTSLTSLSVLRRNHPAPALVNAMNATQLDAARFLASTRAARLRPTWAAISAAILLLSELSSYFQGEVVAGSWATFQAWIAEDTTSRPVYPSTSLSASTISTTSSTTTTSLSSAPPDTGSLSHDPATLAHAHRHYLSALAQNLLLTDTAFARSARTLLVRAQHLASLMRRLAIVVRGFVEDPESEHFAREEPQLDAGLRDARAKLHQSVRDIVRRVRQLEGEQVASALDAMRLGHEDDDDGQLVREYVGEENEFVPWKGAGLGRLLMRLEVAGLGSSVGVGGDVGLDGKREREGGDRLLV